MEVNVVQKTPEGVGVIKPGQRKTLVIPDVSATTKVSVGRTRLPQSAISKKVTRLSRRQPRKF